MDLQGSEFALFERATLLEAEVRKRTTQLEQAMAELQRSNRAHRGGAGRGPMPPTSPRPASSPPPRTICCSRSTPPACSCPPWPRPSCRQSAERLIENVDLAFESIDRLLTALLDISKLDAGVVTPVIENVPLGSAAAPAGRPSSRRWPSARA